MTKIIYIIKRLDNWILLILKGLLLMGGFEAGLTFVSSEIFEATFYEPIFPSQFCRRGAELFDYLGGSIPIIYDN